MIKIVFLIIKQALEEPICLGPALHRRDRSPALFGVRKPDQGAVCGRVLVAACVA